MKFTKEYTCIQTGITCGFPCYHKCPHYGQYAGFSENKLITEGNYDEKIHGPLKEWCDAFGKLVEPPVGYRLLQNNDKANDIVQQGDLHFDIYGGWTDGRTDWYDGRYVQSDGRWRAWARKI